MCFRDATKLRIMKKCFKGLHEIYLYTERDVMSEEDSVAIYNDFI